MTGAVVGGMLGLMAFLLAFSIGIVIGQHNGRKKMIVTEANAVGTAYLRAGFLDEPDRTSSRDLLREYVEVRLAAAADPRRPKREKGNVSWELPLAAIQGRA